MEVFEKVGRGLIGILARCILTGGMSAEIWTGLPLGVDVLVYDSG